MRELLQELRDISSMAMEHFEVSFECSFVQIPICMLCPQAFVCSHTFRLSFFIFPFAILFQERIVPTLRSKLNSQITAQSGQGTSTPVSSKLSRSFTNDGRIIFSPLPRTVCSLPRHDSPSLDDSPSSLNKLFNQLIQSRDQEIQTLKAQVGFR